MSDPEELPVVVAACARFGLGEECHRDVLGMLDRPRHLWLMCCGNDCDPCNGKLRKAALLALEQLGREPRE